MFFKNKVNTKLIQVIVNKIGAFGIISINNSYKKNGKTYHNGMVFLNGAKENKKKFIDSLKDDKRIIKSKASGSQIFVLIEGEDHIAPLMPKEIFFLKPVFFKGGYEYWEIGSWEKAPITKFFEECKSVAQIKLLKLQEEVEMELISKEELHFIEQVWNDEIIHLAKLDSGVVA